MSNNAIVNLAIHCVPFWDLRSGNGTTELQRTECKGEARDSTTFEFEDGRGLVIAINFVLLPSPLLSSPDPDAVTVTYMGLVFDTDIFMHQGTQGSEASVPVHHFRKSFGTSAITRIMYVSPSSRILTSFAFY